MTLEFILGCCVALAVRKRIFCGARICLAGGFLFLVLVGFLGDPLVIQGMRLFAFGIPASLIVYGSVAYELKQGFRFPRLLEKIGDASYSIYLSHILVLSAIGRAWQAVAVDGPWIHTLALTVMLLSAIFTGFASYSYLEVPILRYFQVHRPGSLQNRT
jgi:exopolysaccharide production protein ExoZ